MIWSTSFYLSLSRPELHHHLRTWCYAITLYLSMPCSSVNIKYSIHRGQHTSWSAYADYSIPWVQHTPSTAFTVYCIIPTSTVSCSQSSSYLSADHVALNALPFYNHESIDEYSLSSGHFFLPNYWLLIDPLYVVLQSRSIIIPSKCILKLAWSQPPSESLNWHNHGLQVRTIMASKCISKLTVAWLPSTS